MSHRKWRGTKEQPSRARSGHQISCCLVSLHFLCLSGCPGVMHGISSAKDSVSSFCRGVRKGKQFRPQFKGYSIAIETGREGKHFVSRSVNNAIIAIISRNRTEREREGGRRLGLKLELRQRRTDKLLARATHFSSPFSPSFQPRIPRQIKMSDCCRYL